MPSNSAKKSKLRVMFRWMAISLAAIVTTWIVVIYWWQATQRHVTSTDALLHLVMLPLAVSIFMGMFRRLLMLRRSQTRASANQAHAATITSPQPNPGNNAILPPLKLPILAAWAVTSRSHEGSEFIENLIARRYRPTPDESLTDGQGFPPLTGRVKDLDTTAVAQSLMAMNDISPSVEMPDASEPRDALLRTLALLDSVLQQVARQWPLSTTVPAGRQTAHSQIHTLRGSPATGSDAIEAASLELQVKLLLSDALKPFERQIVQAHAEKRLSVLGMSAMPAVDTIATTDDTTALRLADAFCSEALVTPGNLMPRALLLLACDSPLCPTVVDAWEAQGVLFDARHPNGLMMGEAAFGILCANESALQATAAVPICYLAGVSRAQLANGVPGKIAHECLSGVIATSLGATNIHGSAIGTVVCDADHRTGRTLESIEAMSRQTPQLDAIENRLAVNESCGHLGAASVPALLAAGALQSCSAGHAVLLFNVSHPSERAAAILLPADEEDGAPHIQHLQAA